MGRPAMDDTYRVLVYDSSPAVVEAARRLLGGDASFDLASRSGGPADWDLVVVHRDAVIAISWETLRLRHPTASFLILGPPAVVDGDGFRVRILPAPLDHLRYDQVVARLGECEVREYLSALLRRHGGNVTLAAETAGLERETVHRMIRRHLLKARDYRPERPPRGPSGEG